MLNQWKGELEVLSKQAAAKLGSVKKLLESRSKKAYLSEPEVQDLRRAERIVSTLLARTAVHNTLLGEELLRGAIEDLEKIEEKLVTAQ
ncbi:MAG: hypothetical protein JSW03_02945 [Candidatus Eiseniibacteriota bacterium]|nr:MAG: hypothetical protein JSW03_02945 [Candidatus Eisenbacteria bacterium]